MRIAVFLLAALQIALVALVGMTGTTGGDAAGNAMAAGLTTAAGIVLAVFLVPAVILAIGRRAERLALVLAILPAALFVVFLALL